MKNVKNDKAMVNVSTTTVVDAYYVATDYMSPQSVEENKDILGKKIVDNATVGVEMDAICILDTSGSMGWLGSHDLIDKATALAHGIATHSTYAPNQVISFSSRPRLMTITGNTLKEQYQSMYTGDCSNTDFGRVMEILRGLKKYPEYIIVLSDMEFDYGSSNIPLFKEIELEYKSYGYELPRLIFWNVNSRTGTIPLKENDRGVVLLSGFSTNVVKMAMSGELDPYACLIKTLYSDRYKPIIESLL